MEIKPYDKTIAQVLTDTKYKIPSFQRDYSWDRKYYREFLYDMLCQINSDEEKLVNNDYFLGTMLFLKDNKTDELKVIDGQQRLTTITILFSAISRLLREKNQNSLADATFKYIVFKDRRGEEQKVIYPPNSFPYFTKVIQKIEIDTKIKSKTDEEDLIKETYDYFRSVLSESKIENTIKGAFKNKGDLEPIDIDKFDYVDILIALRDQVLDSKLIYIETTSHRQANMIFEILNAKGKKLTSIDLIKNKIFENVGTTIDEEAEVQWKKIQNELQKHEIPMLVFFRHFWGSKYKKISANTLYKYMNAEISKGNKELKKKRTIYMLEELNRNAKLYTYIDSPSDLEFWDNNRAYQEIIDSLLFIKGFNITQYRIAVLALIRAKRDDKINMKWFKKSIICIEEFSFVFFQLLSARASKVENLFSKFAIELTKCKKEEVTDKIEKILLEGLNKLMPSYEEFKVKFIELEYTNKRPKDETDYVSVKYIINKINKYYSENDKFVDLNCSIEHIIPDDINDNRTLNIGNLLPLEEEINNRLEGITYDEKKEGYLKSNYKEVQDFVKSNNLWGIENVEERAIEMADLFYHKILSDEIVKKQSLE